MEEEKIFNLVKWQGSPLTVTDRKAAAAMFFILRLNANGKLVGRRKMAVTIATAIFRNIKNSTNHWYQAYRPFAEYFPIFNSKRTDRPIVRKLSGGWDNIPAPAVPRLASLFSCSGSGETEFGLLITPYVKT